MAILRIKDINGNWINVPAIKGQSAYEIAKENSFEGTEQEWLDSLKGKQGKTAYQYAQDGGFTGTEEEFAILLNNIPSYNNPSITDIVTRHRRYDFTRVAKGITYTDEDHPNKIVYGSSFQFEHSYTDADLVGRTYYGYDFGTLDGGGYVSISVPKTKYLKGEKSIPVSYSWSVVNNQRSNQPAINRAVIGIYNSKNLEANLNMPVEERTTMTYFDAYEYFGTISNGSYIGQTNSDGLYTETLYTSDREGVTRDITYTASKITSWGYNSVIQVSSNQYSGVATLDISNLEAGTYRIMFTNYTIPDWPVENIIDGNPYQILNEIEIEIVDEMYSTQYPIAEEQTV